MTEPLSPGNTVPTAWASQLGAYLIELRVHTVEHVTVARFTREDMGNLYAEVDQPEDETILGHLTGLAQSTRAVAWARSEPWQIAVKGADRVQVEYDKPGTVWLAHDRDSDITVHTSRAGAMDRLDQYGATHGLTGGRWWDDPAKPGRMVGDSGYVRPLEVSP